MKLILTTLNAKYTHSSLALRYLRAYCQSLPIEIKVQEFTINQQLLDILGQLAEEKPQIIGFACYIWNIDMVVKLSRLLKKVLPTVKIVCGGPEVSYDAAEFLQRNPSVDYVVQGEGEITFYKLLTAMLYGQPSTAIEAIAYRADNGVVVAGQAAVVTDLVKLPFPYQLAEMASLSEKIIYYESSRGCPFSCQYCLSSATQGVRFLPLERVLGDLQYFIDQAVRQVKFVDRTFNAKKEHYLAIWRFLARQDCQTNFHFEVAVDLMDEEVLQVLQTMPAGRIQLEIGVQSTNPLTLQRINRINHWDKIVYNVRRLLAMATMHLHLDLIIGLPEEDYQSFERSFNDVYQLQPQMLQIGFLKMLKGSGLTSRSAVDDYVFMDIAPYQVLANRFITYAEIRKLQIFETVFEQYYNSGRFRHTIRYLVAVVGNAFRFYEQLTEFWQQKQLHLMSHAAKSLYGYLFEFGKINFPKQGDIIAQLLKFDALTTDKAGILPEFLPWSEQKFYDRITAFWRGDNVKNYLPEYQFTNWRDLKKKHRIEVFSISPPKWQTAGEIEWRQTVILFSYQDNKVVYQTITTADFGAERSEK